MCYRELPCLTYYNASREKSKCTFFLVQIKIQKIDPDMSRFSAMFDVLQFSNKTTKADSLTISI